MRRFSPFLLLLGLLAACASPGTDDVASDSGQSGPIVTVFYSPA